MDDNSHKLDETLLSAYLSTDYYINLKKKSVKIGVKTPWLKKWLTSLATDGQVLTYAFITAYNPYSQPLTDIENEIRNEGLKRFLEKEGYLFFPAEHRDPAGRWEVEHSFFVLFIEREKAMEIGCIFGQNAIVFGVASELPYLENKSHSFSRWKHKVRL